MIGPQIRAIAWAQFRTMRNHLPRTNAGTILLWLLALVWHGIFAALGVLLAVELPKVPLEELRAWVPVGLLAVFLFWQLVPLFTLSGGWSLQLNKLQIYPVSTGSLFGIETFLRLTTAPEMVSVLAGAFIGLVRNVEVPLGAPLFLLVFIPLNLFLSLGIREFILHAFERNRFRELFAILIIGIAILPQLLARTELGRRLTPYFLAIARGNFTPWRQVSDLSVGSFSLLDILLVLWISVFYLFARWQFEKGLRQDDSFRAGGTPVAPRAGTETAARPKRLLDIPNLLFKDPLAALLQKEFRSLVRMPRFRITFGMACVFSVILFLPVGLNSARGHSTFMRDNFLPAVTLYGLLLLSDVLLINAFGFDRRAAQIYFVAPIPLESVLKAKNLTAIFFIAVQATVVLLLAMTMRMGVTPLNIGNAVAAAAVVGVYFLCIGNFTSIAMPRPTDPAQTLRKQGGGKMQFWFILCSLGMFLLVGFAFLARWATQRSWAALAVLLIEFAIGLIVYRIATQSAIERAQRARENLIEALSRGASPIGLGGS